MKTQLSICIALFIPLLAFAEFDHSSYTDILKTYVNDAGEVDYKALKKDRAGLDAYLQSLEAVSEAESKSWSSDEKMAFYINAYNAKTLQVIIDHIPIKPSWVAKVRGYELGIRHIAGVWDDYKTSLLGRELSLNEIEHEVLRKEFNDPRIHMGLVCASISCPLLRTEAYTGKKLDEQLDEQTQHFLSDPTKFNIDEENGVVNISPIFSWFYEDFIRAGFNNRELKGYTQKSRSILSFIHQHLPEAEAKKLASNSLKVEYLPYDWGLNKQEP